MPPKKQPVRKLPRKHSIRPAPRAVRGARGRGIGGIAGAIETAKG